MGRSYGAISYSNVHYFSRFVDEKYDSVGENSIVSERQYSGTTRGRNQYGQQHYTNTYIAPDSFIPDIFLSRSRPKSRFVVDNNEARIIAEEIFELMMHGRLDNNISINVLPFDEFKALHSRFGAWSNGILGFSITRKSRKIFVRENQLDELMIVLGHEIGHVLTETLPNKHDEEAKAFAFSIEWAKTIKKHNVANLGLNIKDNLDFNPARNGLHDIAFEFVDLMVKQGIMAMQLHDDLAKKYKSIFNKVYL